MQSIYEKTTGYLTVSFKDKDHVLAAPTSATWEAIDVATGQTVKPATAMSPIASPFVITIPVTVNTLLNTNQEDERRRIVVRASYGQDDGLTIPYEYRLLCAEGIKV